MIKYNGKYFDVGDKASYSKVATKEIIEALAVISEDYNPIHLDEEYAKKTKFKNCIAHGIFCLGLISKIVGMDMPGEGSIFVNERLEYRYPVFINDVITANVEITNIFEEKKLLKIDINCTNQDNKCVIEGNALIKLV